LGRRGSTSFGEQFPRENENKFPQIASSLGDQVSKCLKRKYKGFVQIKHSLYNWKKKLSKHKH
jgi:hypothetical protein